MVARPCGNNLADPPICAPPTPPCAPESRSRVYGCICRGCAGVSDVGVRVYRARVCGCTGYPSRVTDMRVYPSRVCGLISRGCTGVSVMGVRVYPSRVYPSRVCGCIGRGRAGVSVAGVRVYPLRVYGWVFG
eukprot:1190651-Prorocentrum_minimum.AAC.1